jgi:hypothetical protein
MLAKSTCRGELMGLKGKEVFALIEYSVDHSPSKAQ